jgi:hypothetical protein
MNNDETYWIDGISFEGIKTSVFIRPGDEYYWIDGVTGTAIYPITNSDTGKFMIMFD